MLTLPLLVADSDKKIVFANDKTLSLLEVDRANLNNLFLDKIFQLKDQEFSKIREAISNDESYHGTCLFKHDNDEYSHINILVKGIKIPLKTELGYYIELKKAQKVEMTEEDLKRLGYKTSKIAHEISNPLAVLRIHCDNFSLLAQKNKSFTSQEVLDHMKTLSNATDRLNVSNDELKVLSKSLMNLDMNQLQGILDSDKDAPSH